MPGELEAVVREMYALFDRDCHGKSLARQQAVP